MVQFVAVSKERHANHKWIRHADFHFAASDALAPVVGAEVGRAALSMPLAFTEASGVYHLVAVLSVVSSRNMFVGPDGRWLGAHCPAWFRAYPFRLLPMQGSADERVLCVDEHSKLFVDRSVDGDEFFSQDGNLSPALKVAVDFLTALERNRRATDMAVAALAEAGVIRPWQLKLRTEQGERAVEGLYQISEAALNELSDDAFLKLRKAAALGLADAQMLSMGNCAIFEKLAAFHNSAPSAPLTTMLPDTVDSLFEGLNDDTVRFR